MKLVAFGACRLLVNQVQPLFLAWRGTKTVACILLDGVGNSLPSKLGLLADDFRAAVPCLLSNGPYETGDLQMTLLVKANVTKAGVNSHACSARQVVSVSRRGPW